MAEPNDGSIVIDCELDTEGLKAGSSELLNAIKSLSNQVKTLGDTIKSTFSSSGQVAQSASTDMQQYQQTVTDLENKVKTLQDTIAELRRTGSSGEVLNFGGTSGKASALEKEVQAVARSVEKLGPTFEKAMAGDERAISQLQAKLGPLQDQVVQLQQNLAQTANNKIPTEEYSRLQKELEKAGKALDTLYNRQERMSATGVKENSRTWRNLQFDIQKAEEQISRYETRMAQLQASGGSHVLASQTTAYQTMSGTLSSLNGQLGSMATALTDTEAPGSTAASTALNLVSAFRSVGSAALSFVGGTAKLAFRGLTATVKTAGKHVFSLASGLTLAKKATKTLGKAMGFLSGRLKRMLVFRIMSTMFSGITEGIQNLAKVSSDFNEDMSELKSSLAQIKNSFAAAFAPILNVVIPILTGFMSTLVRVIDTIGMFVAALTGARTYKKAVKVQEDYAASLDKTGASAEEAKNQLAGFDDLNILSDTSKSGGGAADTPDPSTMFENVAIDSPVLDFAATLKEAFKNGDYEGVGQILGEKLNGIITRAGELISWDNIGPSITEGITAVTGIINSTVTTVDWGAAGKTLSEGVKTLIKTGAAAVTAMDWKQLGKSLADFVAGIDYTGIANSLFKGIGAALGGLSAFIWGLVEDAWDEMVSWWYDTAYEDGEFTIEGLLKGIGKAIKGIGKWIKNNIFEPFIDGFKEAFGIHSPSTVMEEQGGYIIAGLLRGIEDAWRDILSFFGDALSSLKKNLSDAWAKIEDKASKAWSKVSKTMGDAWDKAKSWTSESVKNIRDKCSEGWDKVKSGASSAWSKVTDTVEDAWSDIKSWVAKKGAETEKSASSTWSSVKKDTASAHSTIESDVSKTWADVKSNISKQIDNAKKAVSDGWRALTSNTSKTNSGISTDVSKTWADVKSNISKQIDNAKTAATNGWKSMSSDTTSQNNGIKNTVSNAWSDVKSKISDHLNKAKSAASSAWSSMKSTATSDNNSIKNSLSNTWSSIKTTLTNSMSSIQNSMSNTFSNLKSNASTWGKHICENLANGINNFNYKVANAAKKLAQKIKDFLGFSEPDKGPLSNFHTYMPDMIDLMVEGMEGNKHRAAAAAAGIAQAISDEVQSDYSTGNIVPNGQIDSALNNFSDKITDSFTGLMDKLQAIASGVTFASPVVASRAVPYSVSAKASGSDTQLSSTIEAGNDRMEALVSRVVTQATASIVAAIRSSGTGNGTGMDIATVTTAIINDINRRTVMNNKSPLLG